jgi:glycosidase
VLQLTSIGIPVITWGDEVGRKGGAWPENRSDMPWGAAQSASLHATYQKLIAVRRAHKALSRGTMATVGSTDDALAYLRALPDGDDRVLVAVNRADSPQRLEVTLPAELAGVAAWRDQLGDAAPLAPQGGKLVLDLPPEGALVLAPAPAR